MKKEEKIYELQKQIAALCDENQRLRIKFEKAQEELQKWEKMTAEELGEMLAGI